MLVLENTIINALSKIKHPVSEFLIYKSAGIEYSRQFIFNKEANLFDINFVILAPNGMLEVSTKQQIADVINELGAIDIDKLTVGNVFQTLIDKKMRVPIKPGRLITKLNISLSNINDNDKAKFGELFTAKIQMYVVDVSSIKIVSGNQIAHAYHVDNYAYDTGELATSCMRYDSCQEFLAIYTEQPEVVKLVISTIGDKITGRCLLWLDKYYDRIYFANYNTYLAIQAFCEHSGYERIYYREFIVRDNISVPLKRNFSYYSPYPYMDSFRYVNTKDNTLNINPQNCNYALNDTGGDYNVFNICCICGETDLTAQLTYYTADDDYYCDRHCPDFEN